MPCPVADTLFISLLMRFSAWFFVTCLKSCLLILKIWSPGWRLKKWWRWDSNPVLWNSRLRNSWLCDLKFGVEVRLKVGQNRCFKVKHRLNCQKCLRWDLWLIDQVSWWYLFLKLVKNELSFELSIGRWRHFWKGVN